MEGIQLPFDLDLIFFPNDTSFENIQIFQSKVQDFFTKKGLKNSASIVYLNPHHPFCYANTKVQTEEGLIDFTLSGVKNSEKLLSKIVFPCRY